MCITRYLKNRAKIEIINTNIVFMFRFVKEIDCEEKELEEDDKKMKIGVDWGRMLRKNLMRQARSSSLSSILISNVSSFGRSSSVIEWDQLISI